MSAGGHSFHKKQWAEVAAMAALAATGAGAAGIGPMAGLLGGDEAAGAGAAGAGLGAAAIPEAGSALAGASGLTDLAGATGSALASTPSVAAPSMFSGFADKLGPTLGNMGKVSQAAQMSGLLAPPQAPHPMSPPPISQPMGPTVNLYGPGGVQEKIAAMSPQERQRMLMQLQQYAGA